MSQCVLSQLTARKKDTANGEVFSILNYNTVFFFGYH